MTSTFMVHIGEPYSTARLDFPLFHGEIMKQEKKHHHRPKCRSKENKQLISCSGFIYMMKYKMCRGYLSLAKPKRLQEIFWIGAILKRT